LAAKDHVNVFLYDGAIVPDPAGIITGGHENKSVRTLSIRQGEHIGGRTLPGRRRKSVASLPLAGAPGGVLGGPHGDLSPGPALAVMVAGTLTIFAAAAWRPRSRDLV
jgi:hypothetical protein